MTVAKYHPLRFAQSRPYAKKAASTLRSMLGTNPAGPTHAALDAVAGLVMQGYNEALEDIPREDRPAELALPMKEVSYTLVYGMFSISGRNIFDIDPTLVEMFHHTDVGDIPLATLQAPYDNLYLHFGPQQSLPMFDGSVVVEGAYVVFNPEVLQIYLATQRLTGEQTHIVTAPDRYYYLPIPLRDSGQTVRDALDTAITSEVDAKKASSDWKEAFAEAAEEARGLGFQLTSGYEKSSLKAQSEVIEGATTFIDAMNLVLNSLCYLTAYQEEIQVGWPEQTPASLKEKAENGKTLRERRRAESKLLPLGFTQVRFCRAVQPDGSGDGFMQDGELRRAHWRRGHWRNQPIGPRNDHKRQLRWIRPTYVGKGDAKAISGHLYSVQKPAE